MEAMHEEECCCYLKEEDNMLASIFFFFLRKNHVAYLSIMLGPSIISSILL